MAIEWYEWECPHCRRIGQVNPAKDYMDGEVIRTNCPNCGVEVVVLCAYEPTFYAYRPEFGMTLGEVRQMMNRDAERERTCKRFWTGAEMICSKCAHQLNDETVHFCPSCGAKVVD